MPNKNGHRIIQIFKPIPGVLAGGTDFKVKCFRGHRTAPMDIGYIYASTPPHGHWIIQIFKPIPGVVAGGTVSKGKCEGARQWILNIFKPFGLVVRRHRDFPKDRQTTALKSKYLFQ